MTKVQGLPLTRWTTYLYEDVWQMLTESVLGTCAALVIGLWEYYQQVEHDRQEEIYTYPQPLFCKQCSYDRKATFLELFYLLLDMASSVPFVYV